MRLAIIIITALVAGASSGTLHGRKNKGNANNDGDVATGATTDAAAAAGSVQRGTTTMVFKEDNGVPGNECLTFRNNGEIVDAACVDTAIDRQMTPSTLSNGQDVLLVQRTFTADFRADLVDAQACVGNNGTTFLAQDCATATDLVRFNAQTNEMVAASGACQSGHDEAAQVTVDSTGQNCATFTTTTVTPATA